MKKSGATSVQHLKSANLLIAKFGHPLPTPLMSSYNVFADRIPKEIRNSRMLLAAIIDNQGQLLYCNDLLATKVNPHTASYLHYSEVIHQLDLHNFRNGMSIALSGKTASNVSARVVDAHEGTDIIVLWEISPSEDPLKKEQIVLAVGVILPVAPLQKVVDSTDSEMITNLVKRNRDLEQFANIVSHNIRAPLANIMGLNRLLNLKLSEADKDMAIKGISISAEKLESVIKDLNEVLQVRRADASSADTINLLRLVDDIRLSIGDTINKTQATIICDFEEMHEVKAIKSYLQSIFFNLITNAIKYARRGVPPVVNIRSMRKDNHVQITFTDNGSGIDLAKHGSNLFGLYKRFTDEVEGKGLGLYMVKTQVEAMGGTIDVESVLGEGTTFRITLPG